MRICKIYIYIFKKNLFCPQFNSNIKNRRSAPYRTVTVRDAMSDLADVNNEANAVEIPYKGWFTLFNSVLSGCI